MLYSHAIVSLVKTVMSTNLYLIIRLKVIIKVKKFLLTIVHQTKFI